MSEQDKKDLAYFDEAMDTANKKVFYNGVEVKK
jgi:hypothetical protein